MNTIERRVKVALWATQEIGPKSIESILSAISVSELYEQSVPQWIAKCDLFPKQRKALLESKPLAQVADEIERQCDLLKYRLTLAGDSDWPETLSGIDTCPAVLATQGPVTVPMRRRMAIVGTRHPETGVLEHVQHFAAELASNGVGIISGAAEGVDQAAHSGAILAGGETWAFIGSAIEEAGSTQKAYYEYILANNGRIFSEHPPGSKPAKHTFPMRNRLISGASDAVLVFRAGLGSGALYTSTYATKQGRPLLAIPGDIWAQHSAGCNELIRDQKAQACLGVDDALQALGLKGQLVAPEAAQVNAIDFSAGAKSVLKVLTKTPQTFDEIECLARPLASGSISAALLELELGGAVIQRPGRRYERC